MTQLTKVQIERRLKLIEVEINLWRTPWQSRETPLKEKSLILNHVADLIQEEKQLRKKLDEYNT